MEIKEVCDLCKYGDSENRRCYAGSKCYENSTYTKFLPDMEKIDELNK